MRRILAFVVTDNIKLVLADLIDKVGRLIHVIPDSGHAVVKISTMQVSPPAPRFRQSVIDKDAVTGPDFGNKEFAVFAMLEIFLLESLIVNVVALILRFQLRVRRFTRRDILCRRLIFHTRIDDRN